MIGHVMEGSFSTLSTSSSALAHCFTRPLLLVQGVGTLAERITAASWNRISFPGGRLGAEARELPLSMMGQRDWFFGQRALQHELAPYDAVVVWGKL